MSLCIFRLTVNSSSHHQIIFLTALTLAMLAHSISMLQLCLSPARSLTTAHARSLLTSLTLSGRLVAHPYNHHSSDLLSVSCRCAMEWYIKQAGTYISCMLVRHGITRPRLRRIRPQLGRTRPRLGTVSPCLERPFRCDVRTRVPSVGRGESWDH